MKLTSDFSITSVPAYRPRAGHPWDMPWRSPISGAPPTMVMDFASGSFGLGGLAVQQSDALVIRRASPASHIDASGALSFVADDVARIDHDPVAKGPIGLLTESAASNLIVNSETPDNQSVDVSAQEYCLSFYGDGNVELGGAHVQTVTGEGDFPRRTVITFTPVAGTLSIAFTGSVVAPQLEGGRIASSYFATGATGGGRSADDASCPLGTWFSGSEGTLVFNGMLRHAMANERLVEIDAGSPASRISILWNAVLNKPQLQVWDAGSLQAALVPPGPEVAFDQPFSVSIAFADNDFAVSLDGYAAAADGIGTVADGLSTLRIGRALGGAQSDLVTESILYYDQRLSDAELQLLSV